MRSIVRREWWWVAVCSGLLITLVTIPYAIALIRPPDGYLLARTLYYGNDLSQYLAAMGDGARTGSWLVHDHFTSEPHSPALMYPFYVLLGKVAALTSLDPLVLFAVAVVLSTAVLAVAAYAFSATFLHEPWARRAALVLVIFSSGFGIWVAAVTMVGSSGESGADVFAFDRAEVSGFFLPFGPPHLPLALAFILLAGRAMAQWSWEGRRAVLPVLGLSAAAVGLLNSFSLASLLGMAGACALAAWVSRRAFPRGEAVAIIWVALFGAPVLLTSFVTFYLDPFWSVAYGQQNTTGSPPPWVLAVEFAPLLPLAVWGALWAKGEGGARLLLVAWVVVLLVMMYLPVPYQRRFGFGVQPALAVLAVLGIARLESFLGEARVRARARRLLVGSLVALPLSSAMLAYGLLIMASMGSGVLAETMFESEGNVAAADWLASNTGAADVVLSSVETGNYLAGRIPGRVVAGHGAGTIDADRREEMVEAFFSAEVPSRERWDTAIRESVTYVVLGARERSLGVDALDDEGFTLVHDGEDVDIYRVKRS